MIKILYKAKKKDGSGWIEGVPYETTPLYCVKEDYEKMGQTFVMIYPSFADWGMPRYMESVEIDHNTLYRYTGERDGYPIWEKVK